MSTNIDTVPKEKMDIDITENNMVNNSFNNNNNEKQDKYIQKKDMVNIDNKLKRKNVLNNDDIPKKRKMNNEKEKSSRIEMDNINVNAKKHNEEVTSVGKHKTAQKKKRKNSQLNKMKNKKLGNAHPTVFSNAKRLKTYGINAKKMKNKLLRHDKF